MNGSSKTGQVLITVKLVGVMIPENNIFRFKIIISFFSLMKQSLFPP